MVEPMNEADDQTTTKPEVAPTVLMQVLAEMERNAYVTKNPLFAWIAIAQCVEHNLPVPEFVLEYIKDVAVALDPFIHEAILKKPTEKIKPEEISKRVLAALQITTGAGRPNAFENIRRDFDAELTLLNEPSAKVCASRIT